MGQLHELPVDSSLLPDLNGFPHFAECPDCRSQSDIREDAA